jgi:osmotically-inducible protein OsmY
MNKDRELKEQVEQELAWNPAIGEGHIAVAVREGVVTLAGFVDTYFERVEAERAAQGVAGVLGVANEVEVRLSDNVRPDPDIVLDAVAALKLQMPHSAPRILVIVSEGRLRLEGEVDWHYLRERAAEAVRALPGVRSVVNHIALKPGALPRDVHCRIVSAFHRSADIDARGITVDASGSDVILRGKVSTWAERDAAERAAWQAPGVSHVLNQIAIGPGA